MLLLFSLGCSSVPKDRVMIEGFSPTVAIGLSQAFENAKSRVVVFDMDNTILRNDLGDAAFRLMVDNVWFAPDIFQDPDIVRDIPESQLGDLRRLFRSLQGTIQRHPMFRSSINYRNFTLMMYRIYADMCKKQGEGRCYQWSAQLFSGLSRERVKQLANLIVEEELRQPVRMVKRGTMKFPSGIRFHTAMKNLIQELQQKGFRVYVITASLQELAEEALKTCCGLGSEYILGVKLDEKDNKLTSRVLRFPFRATKAEIIREELKVIPDAAFGDSDNDLEMLELARGAKVVIDRGEPITATALERQRQGQPWFIQPQKSLDTFP